MDTTAEDKKFSSQYTISSPITKCADSLHTSQRDLSLLLHTSFLYFVTTVCTVVQFYRSQYMNTYFNSNLT